MVLQAFVIFLAVLRRNDNARVVWTLTGLAVRIAQVIGVHRDGIYFGLVPFEVEMRRRLWWQVCLLDARASQVPPVPVEKKLSQANHEGYLEKTMGVTLQLSRHNLTPKCL